VYSWHIGGHRNLSSEDYTDAFYSPSAKSLYVFKKGNLVQTFDNTYIDLFAYIGKLGKVFTSNGNTLVFDVIPHKNIVKIHGQIISLTASASSKCVVISTTDQHIMIYNLTGRLQGSFTVKSPILNLLISHCWGFILVQTYNKIIITNSNGLLLFEKDISDLSSIFTIHSRHGFDYFVLETNRHSLHLLSTETFSIQQICSRMDPRMTSLVFHNKGSSLHHILDMMVSCGKQDTE